MEPLEDLRRAYAVETASTAITTPMAAMTQPNGTTKLRPLEAHHHRLVNEEGDDGAECQADGQPPPGV